MIGLWAAAEIAVAVMCTRRNIRTEIKRIKKNVLLKDHTFPHEWTWTERHGRSTIVKRRSSPTSRVVSSICFRGSFPFISTRWTLKVFQAKLKSQKPYSLSSFSIYLSIYTPSSAIHSYAFICIVFSKISFEYTGVYGWCAFWERVCTWWLRSIFYTLDFSIFFLDNYFENF